MTHDPIPAIVRIDPPELGIPPGPSQVVEVSARRIIFISGQTALDRDGNLVGKADFPAQAAQVFSQSRHCAGGERMHGSQSGEADGVPHRHGQSRPLSRGAHRFFASVTPPAAPAVTLVEVSRQYGADFMIEIEAIAAA